METNNVGTKHIAFTKIGLNLFSSPLAKYMATIMVYDEDVMVNNK